MQGKIIAEQFKKMVWVRDQNGKEYACNIDNIKNIKDMTEDEKKNCMDLSLVLGDSW